MTPASPIPEYLLRFLDANVDSIEQLEILRLVAESPARQWTTQELVAQAQAPAAAITALERRGLLLSQAVGSDVVYCAAPLEQGTARVLAELLQLYNERPVTLIKHLYSR